MKKLLIIGFAILLSACAQKTKTETLLSPIIVPTQKAEITVPKLTLLPTKVEAPRDIKNKVLNTNDPTCTETKPGCMIAPIDLEGSNLYRGYDKKNWDNVRINNARIDEYIRTLLLLIDQQNATIRKDNAEAKAQMEKIKASNTPTQ